MKKLFFLIYVCTGIAILFQASKFIDTSLEKRILDHPVDIKVENKPKRVPRLAVSDVYDVSLFNSPLFSLSETNSESPDANEPEIEDSPLLKKYELNGVIILPGRRSIALIRRVREPQSGIYRMGDMIDNLEIVKIERQRVFLNDGLKTNILPMYIERKRRTVSRKQEAKPARSESDDYSSAKQLKKVLSRSDVENKVFSKVNQILTQIAISPYMVNGTMQGMRLIRVPNNSIVYELGGRSGDIIRRVNGHELSQIDQMYKLWDNIKDDSAISVDLERKNQMYTYNFEIRE